jgi:signal transduction histidine kinase/ActR/RegA family two-component response regulator
MFRFHNLPIRQKLSIVVLLTCSSLVVLIAGLFIADKYFSYRRNMVANIATLAEVIGINSTAALTFQDQGTAEETLSALTAEPDVTAACIFTPDGQLFAAYTKPLAAGGRQAIATAHLIQQLKNRFDAQAELHIFSGNFLDLSKPILLKQKQIGHIVIRTDLHRLHHRLTMAIIMVVGIVVVLIIATQLITSRLHMAISRPLIDLVHTMKEVSTEKNYALRANKYRSDELGTLIDGFNGMLTQIQSRDLQLKEHGNQLEDLVGQRTRELMGANEKLKQEMEERKAAQEQLARAQRMEAIGTLASGVAHDLNNILSGIVSYPDLLLMRLPDTSEMRKPLETIQKSGQKAAAIVQDLLTLARRGVITTEVVDLRHIVEEYLESPECAKMRSYHPEVRFKTQFAPDLMDIAGSTVHLSKTIMNIASNAAEAITDSGTITITLRNQYIDTPIQGYDQVQQGDYVLLKISDTGHGIAPRDLERIFEPFYTKKKMGRSGTGLGMAVVWGTIKDHNGYIDVESRQGAGTTFDLYFPVTRQRPKNHAPMNLSDYAGSGQTVLVVDDVKEQREIAKEILNELGYQSHALPSGEAALAYLQNNSVDILLLDMIMNPGMDGLQTYQRIVEIHPAQRAIIASGYSESQRVKQAQQLGAGLYLRKPYTITNLAMAIYNELHRPDNPTENLPISPG